MEPLTEFSAEDLEIVELPQREALGKGGGKNHINQNGPGGGGLLGDIAIILDIF